MPAPNTPPAETRRGGFLPLVFGGIIAAGLGFAAAEMNLLNTRADVGALEASVAAQEAAVAAQAEQIAALEAAEPPAVPDISALESNLADVVARVDALEARPAVVAADDDDNGAAYAAELAALQASVETQKAEIQQLLDNAMSVEEATANAARTAAAQTALAEITTAIGSGAPYESAMAALEASGVGDIPAGLAATAADGAPTLLSLQSDFGDLARAALTASRSAGTDGGGDGLGSFLRRQLGARSVAPREGSDPDAVLSRVEGAVRVGDLDTALSEIDALPPEAQETMADWLDQARARADALAAAQELSQRLTAN
ncbi:MAG: hypothetical protein AAF307_01755 [Pseudomonadota bacterium]